MMPVLPVCGPDCSCHGLSEALLDVVDREEARLEDEAWCDKCPYPMAAHPQIHGPALTVDVCPSETMVREWWGR